MHLHYVKLDHCFDDNDDDDDDEWYFKSRRHLLLAHLTEVWTEQSPMCR